MAKTRKDYPPFYTRIIFPAFKKRISQVSGLENVPKSGPYLVVANHIGSFDPPMIIAVLHDVIQQLIYFVSEQYIVDVLGLPRAVIRLGLIPKIEDQKAECLERAKEYLHKGYIVGIFPEGMRNNGPVLLRGRTGAARLALWTKTPILPIGYKGPGTWSIRQSLKLWFFGLKPKAEITIGKPFTMPEFYDQPITYELLRAATAKIMRTIAPLANKPYPYS